MGAPSAEAIKNAVAFVSDPSNPPEQVAAVKKALGSLAPFAAVGPKIDKAIADKPPAPVGEAIPTPKPPPQAATPVAPAAGGPHKETFAEATARRLRELNPPTPPAQPTSVTTPRELSTDSLEFKASQLPYIGPFLGPLLGPLPTQRTAFEDPSKTPAQNDAGWQEMMQRQKTAGVPGETLVRQSQTSGPEAIAGNGALYGATIAHALSSSMFGMPEMAANLAFPHEAQQSSGEGDAISRVAMTNPKAAIATELLAGAGKGTATRGLADTVGEALGAGKSLIRAAGTAAGTGAAASAVHDAAQASSDLAGTGQTDVTPGGTLENMKDSAGMASVLFPVAMALGIPAAALVGKLRTDTGGESLVEAENAGLRTKPNPMSPIKVTPAIKESQRLQGTQTGFPAKAAQDFTVGKAAEEATRGLEGVRQSTVGKIANEKAAYQASPEGQAMVNTGPVVGKIEALIRSLTDAEGRPIQGNEEHVASLKKALESATEEIDPGGAPPRAPLEQRINETPADAQARAAVGARSPTRAPRDVNAQQLEAVTEAYNKTYGVHTDEAAAKLDKEIAGALRDLRSKFMPNETAPQGYDALRQEHHAQRTEMESTLQAFGLNKNLASASPEVQSQLQAVLNAVKRGGQSDDQIAAVIEQNGAAKKALTDARGHLAYDKLHNQGTGVNAAVTEAGKAHAYMHAGKRVTLSADPIMRSIAGVEQYPAIANMPAPMALAGARAGGAAGADQEDPAAQLQRVLDRFIK